MKAFRSATIGLSANKARNQVNAVVTTPKPVALERSVHEQIEDDTELEALFEEYQALLMHQQRPAMFVLPAIEDFNVQVDANRLVSLI